MMASGACLACRKVSIVAAIRSGRMARLAQRRAPAGATAMAKLKPLSVGSQRSRAGTSIRVGSRQGPESARTINPVAISRAIASLSFASPAPQPLRKRSIGASKRDISIASEVEENKCVAYLAKANSGRQCPTHGRTAEREPAGRSPLCSILIETVHGHPPARFERKAPVAGGITVTVLEFDEIVQFAVHGRFLGMDHGGPMPGAGLTGPGEAGQSGEAGFFELAALLDAERNFACGVAADGAEFDQVRCFP